MIKQQPHPGDEVDQATRFVSIAKLWHAGRRLSSAKTNTVNARISARGAYLIFYGERGALIRRGGGGGGRVFKEGRLFRLSIFGLKMTHLYF